MPLYDNAACEHLNGIYAEGELESERAIRKFRMVRSATVRSKLGLY
ncbi:MAG: hypothetical protein ACREQ4_04860 [Candidatus Binataceae bacterium]